ncbi:MAG: hypothetical protein ACRDD6_11730 [Tannerellaceae bacterium]
MRGDYATNILVTFAHDIHLIVRVHAVLAHRALAELNGVAETIPNETSLQTSAMVRGIKKLMMECKNKIRTDLPKIYSQDLINNLFKHPYTKIDFLVEDLQVSRPTATKYLDQLVEKDLLDKVRIGKEYFFINKELFSYLYNVAQIFPFDSNEK